jgi:hypothetical protein
MPLVVEEVQAEVAAPPPAATPAARSAAATMTPQDVEHIMARRSERLARLHVD